MTDQEIADLGPAFASYLNRYRGCFAQKRTAEHFGTYCRGLMSDLGRKSVEPIALAAGTAVRTLQEFLAAGRWDHAAALDTLQRFLAGELAAAPADELGTVGVIDETSARKWGDQTPGVQRQYLGCVGKVDNGIVTVHVGASRGDFRALLDADLYLPKSWAEDRDRCEAAGIPAAVRYRPKWRIALDQVLRLSERGVSFDWLVFDEGYGAAVPLLRVLNAAGQRFVGEVPVNFAVRDTPGGPPRRADERLTEADARAGKRYRMRRQTVRDAVWRATAVPAWAGGRLLTLVAAVNESTAEVKYFVTNAAGEPLERVLAVAFRRHTVELGFRLAKQEAGLTHYEGREYTGLIRHLTLSLAVLGFVASHTRRLRGGKPAGDAGAGVPGAEPALRGAAAAAAGDAGAGARRGGDPLPPAAQRAGRQVTQEAAA